jgi:hypothetical protein
MTPTFIRPAIALALALALAGCGGKASFPVTGVISGVSYPNLVLTTNGMDLAVAPGATAFTFPNTLSYGDAYEVTVKTPPAHQSCAVVVGGKDTAGRTAAINVIVVCGLNSAALGGKITGLTSTGLILTNGSTGGTFTAGAATTDFTLGTVQFGKSYGVTIFSQPTDNFCTVGANGVGVMGDTDVSVAITCGPKQ